MASMKEAITIRVDRDKAMLAQQRLQEMGLSIDDAVDTLFDHIAREGKLPFSIEKTEEKESREQAMNDLYGETPTPDSSYDPGFLEEDEMSMLVRDK